MEIKNIIKGHTNELFGINKNLSEQRLNICKKCPIYSHEFGGLCNSKLYFDPETNEVSTNRKFGFIKGCGCRLKAKTTVASAHCPADKW